MATAMKVKCVIFLWIDGQGIWFSRSIFGIESAENANNI